MAIVGFCWRRFDSMVCIGRYCYVSHREFVSFHRSNTTAMSVRQKHGHAPNHIACLQKLNSQGHATAAIWYCHSRTLRNIHCEETFHWVRAKFLKKHTWQMPVIYIKHLFELLNKKVLISLAGITDRTYEKENCVQYILESRVSGVSCPTTDPSQDWIQKSSLT